MYHATFRSLALPPLQGIIKKIVTRSSAAVSRGNTFVTRTTAVSVSTTDNNKVSDVDSDNNTLRKNKSGFIVQRSSSSNQAKASEAMKGLMTTISDTFLGEFQDKEWRCQCGHVFRASGEWLACEASRCEAPGCPNPKFFLEGPGKDMLSKDGMVPPPTQLDSNNQQQQQQSSSGGGFSLPSSSSCSEKSNTSSSQQKKNSGCGSSRFK